MAQLLTLIKALVNCLPTKDIKLANKFIEQRKFDDLLELVISDIYKVEHNNPTNPKKELLDINLDKLIELEDAIRRYIDAIYIPDLNYEY